VFNSLGTKGELIDVRGLEFVGLFLERGSKSEAEKEKEAEIILLRTEMVTFCGMFQLVGLKSRCSGSITTLFCKAGMGNNRWVGTVVRTVDLAQTARYLQQR
jgi:hypothetical protein